MTMHSLAAQLTLPLLICVVLLQPADSQQSDKPTIEPPFGLHVEEVVANLVRKNLERTKALDAYQATRTYRLDYSGFPGSRSAEMVVDVSYQRPGMKDFTVRSEKGSKLIIERVFKRLLQSEKEALTEENQSRVALNNENYRFTLLGYENTPSGSHYVLSVEPRTNNKLLYRGQIWVDARDFAVTRIEGEPAKNPSFWTRATKVEQIYGKVDDFWLPKSNRSTSAIRLGGHADLSIDYGTYHITATADTPLNNVPGYR